MSTTNFGKKRLKNTYICVYIYIDMYLYICIHVYINTYVWFCLYEYINTYIWFLRLAAYLQMIRHIFTHDKILYLENPGESNDKLLELIQEC